jgi:hypothetical protein
MDRELGPRAFVGLFGTREPDLQVKTAFVKELGQLHPRPEAAYEAGSAAPAGKVSVSIL